MILSTVCGQNGVIGQFARTTKIREEALVQSSGTQRTMELPVLVLLRKPNNVMYGRRPLLLIVCFHNGLSGVSAQLHVQAVLKKEHVSSPGRR
jgi:hypothetical protein